MRRISKKRKSITLYITLALIMGNVVAWSAVVRAQSRHLTVSFLDVGQGDAVFIETPGGVQMLVDAGANLAVLRELGSVMPFYDRRLDIILTTHPDADHIGGFPEVLRRYAVAGIVEPGSRSDTALYKTWRQAVSAEGAWILHARRGQVLHLDKEVRLEILFPDRDATYMKANNSSIVARLVYGETEVLLTGDAPQSIERHLLSLNAGMLKADVLKVGHHGSKTSTSREFVAAVAPSTAVIQAGADNRYGHPHAEVVEALTRAGTEILGTYKTGRVVIRSDGRRLYIKE